MSFVFHGSGTGAVHPESSFIFWRRCQILGRTKMNFVERKKKDFKSLPKINQKANNLCWKLGSCLQPEAYSILSTKTIISQVSIQNFEASLSILSYSFNIYDSHRWYIHHPSFLTSSSHRAHLGIVFVISLLSLSRILPPLVHLQHQLEISH